MTYEDAAKEYDNQDDDWQYEPLTAEQMGELAENEYNRRLEDE